MSMPETSEDVGSSLVHEVVLLADGAQCVSTLAQWYQAAWPDWFHDMPLNEIEHDLLSCAHRDRMPFGLVALTATGAPLGVCSVRSDPFDSYPDRGPWLRGLYVHAPFRGQGVALELIRAAERVATTLAIPTLYAATSTAISTFESAGWLGFDQVRHDGDMVTIFAKRLS